MKISEIIIEQGPVKPIGSAIQAGTVKRKTNPFGANKALQNMGHQLMHNAEQNTEQGPDKAKPSAGTLLNKAVGTTITTGELDPNLEQYGKDYAKQEMGRLNKAQRPAPKVNQVQNRANK